MIYLFFSSSKLRKSRQNNTRNVWCIRAGTEIIVQFRSLAVGVKLKNPYMKDVTLDCIELLTL
jgi:hypothetical protein